MELRINSTHPAIIRNEDKTLVSIQVDEYYACTCSDDSRAYAVQDGIECDCLNGGKCNDPSDPSKCTCLDSINYGPKCELLTARMAEGFSWFPALGSCESSTLSISFESSQPEGILLYNGPIVAKPYLEYPKDFVYIYYDSTPQVVAYIELGSGTMKLAVPIANMSKEAKDRKTAVLDWNNEGITLSVKNCGRGGPCMDSHTLVGRSPDYIFNTGNPLQLGGMAQMPSFKTLASSYGWTETPESKAYFTGCFSNLQFNDHLYDLNATDYFKNFQGTCQDLKIMAVVQLGAESIVIILVSLLLLLREYT